MINEKKVYFFEKMLSFFTGSSDIMSENKKDKGYVYLLGEFGKDGVYKIGVTRGTIERRIKKLQTGNSNEIYIVDYFQTEHPFFIEKWMHIKHGSKKILNEWFEMSLDEVKAFKNDCQRFENLYKSAHNKKNNDFEYL